MLMLGTLLTYLPPRPVNCRIIPLGQLWQAFNAVSLLQVIIGSHLGFGLVTRSCEILRIEKALEVAAFGYFVKEQVFEMEDCQFGEFN